MAHKRAQQTNDTAFFEALAAMYRANPWRVLSKDESVFTLSIPKLGFDECVVSVIGSTSGPKGFTVFENVKDYQRVLKDAADDQRESVPDHLALTFASKADTPTDIVQAFKENDLELASDEAYPLMYAVAAGKGRLLEPRELELLAACAFVLSQVHIFIGPLRKTHLADKVFKCDFPIDGSQPLLAVVTFEPKSFEAYVWRRLSEQDAFYALSEENRQRFGRKLLELFAASPEAAGIYNGSYCVLVMDIAAQFFERTIITISGADLRKLVFDVIPAKVVMPATEANSLVGELLAFFAFVERRFGFKNADVRRRVLGQKAVPTLEKKLSSS